MNVNDLKEELAYLKTELMKEFEQLESSAISAKKNLTLGKYYRFAEAGFVTRAGRITELTTRIATLDKFITAMENQ